MEQKSIEWYEKRLGKLTASEIYLLMKDRKEPMTEEELAEFKKENPKSRTTTKTVPFSDATFSYLNLKVMERCLPLGSDDESDKNIVREYITQHNITNRAMEHGTLFESMARDMYADKMGYHVIEVGFVPYEKYPNSAGASPDGLIREEIGGIEIKSPFTLEKHMKHFLYQSPEELREEEPEYYWQCIMGMLTTGCEFWDFISFCPYVTGNRMMKILRIPRNVVEINLLEARIDLAVEYMNNKMFELDTTQTIIK